MQVLHHLFNQGRFCNAKHYCASESEAEKAESKGQPFFRTANQVPLSLSQNRHLHQPALCESNISARHDRQTSYATAG